MGHLSIPDNTVGLGGGGVSVPQPFLCFPYEYYQRITRCANGVGKELNIWDVHFSPHQFLELTSANFYLELLGREA